MGTSGVNLVGSGVNFKPQNYKVNTNIVNQALSNEVVEYDKIDYSNPDPLKNSDINGANLNFNDDKDQALAKYKKQETEAESKNIDEDEGNFFTDIFNGVADTVSGVVSTITGIFDDIKNNDNAVEYAKILGESALVGLLQPIEQTIDCTVQATSELFLLPAELAMFTCEKMGFNVDSSKQALNSVENGLSWFIGKNWGTELTNAWIDSTVSNNVKYKDDVVSFTRTVEDSVGSAMLAKLPWPWSAISSAVTMEGKSAEAAYQAGASFTGAALQSHVAGLEGFAFGAIMNKINGAAAKSTTVKQQFGYSFASAGTSNTKNFANAGATYVATGQYEKDEQGNKKYANFFDYFVKNYALTTCVEGITSFATTFNIGKKSVKNYKLNVEISQMTSGQESFKDIKAICDSHGISVSEYQEIASKPTHKLTSEQRKKLFSIRNSLTSAHTTSSGELIPGTKVSKAIGSNTFEKYRTGEWEPGVSNCVALTGDVDALIDSGGSEGLVYGLGLDYEGNPFIQNGKVQDFYIVEGEYDATNTPIHTRISSTTDYVAPTSDTPDAKAIANNQWESNAKSRVQTLYDESGGVPIVVENKNYYNTPKQPDTGTGITLNQKYSNKFGAPEFYAGTVDENHIITGGVTKLNNTKIYKVSNGKKILVATFDEINGFKEV